MERWGHGLEEMMGPWKKSAMDGIGPPVTGKFACETHLVLLSFS